MCVRACLSLSVCVPALPRPRRVRADVLHVPDERPGAHAGLHRGLPAQDARALAPPSQLWQAPQPVAGRDFAT